MELNQVYQAILENMNEEVYVRDLDKNLLYINPASEKLTGWSLEEASGKKCYEVFGDEELICKEVCPVDKAISQKLHILHHEGKLKTRSGDVKDMHVSISPFYDNENIIGAVVVMEDISRLREVEQTNVKTLIALEKEIEERKQAEETLRESEEKYRGIFDESIAATYVFDEKKNFLDSNQAGLDLLGYSREELLNMSIPDVDADPIVVLPAHEQLLGGERIIDYEHRLKRKDGKVITVLNNSKPFTNDDGQVVGMQSTLIDITERKRVEEALRESEERYRTLLGAIPDPVVVYDPEGRATYVNDAFVQVYGWSREALLGDRIDFVPPEETEATQEAWRRTLEDGTVFLETKRWNKNGDLLDIQLRTAILHDQEGKHVLSIVIHRDVTASKLAETALRESEDKHRSLLKNLPSIVYRGHRDWSVEFFDRKIELLTGYAADEFSSREMKWSDIIVKEDIEKAEECFNYALKSDKSYVREYRIKTKAGDILWIQDRGQIVCDDKGKIEYMDGVFFDITEGKQAQQTVLQAKEDWEGTFNALRDLIAIIDDNCRIVRVNTAMADRLGVTPDEAIGLKCYEQVHGTKEPPPDCPHAKLLTNGREHSVEVYEEKLGGDFLITVSPIHGSDDRLIGCVHVARDITERKQADKEKAKLENQLLQAQKMESIGTLAGGIAHDFNNILFPMMGFAEMMLDDLPSNSPHRNNIKEILQGTKRAGDLVKQILTFSRQADQELKPLKVQFIIKEVLKLMRSSLPTTIEIKPYISKECGLVMADATQIHQVAMNLMANAYHAMQDEGGVLEVTLKEVELGVDDLTDPPMTPGAYVCLTVTDTGPGMDQSVIRRIFEPYFTTKENGKGTGLGLAVVHGIAKSFNGDIKVYSEPGRGTAFHVYLPVLKSQVETEETEAITLVLKGTEQILLVDDEDQIVRMEKQMLERLGYQVTTRTSSIEALEAFRAAPDKFDLVITDMTMPNMTGVQLSQKLLEIRPGISILICTGFSEKIDGEKAKAFGIRGYVMKPVIMSELAKKIREVLGQD